MTRRLVRRVQHAGFDILPSTRVPRRARRYELLATGRHRSRTPSVDGLVAKRRGTA